MNLVNINFNDYIMRRENYCCVFYLFNIKKNYVYDKWQLVGQLFFNLLKRKKKKLKLKKYIKIENFIIF